MWRVTLHFNGANLGANQTVTARIEDLREFPEKSGEMCAEAAKLDGQGVYTGKYTIEWDDREPKETKPEQPDDGSVWYRGWEAGQDDMAMRYTDESFIAYKGGCDLDAKNVAAKSWAELLTAIDEEEDDGN